MNILDKFKKQESDGKNRDYYKLKCSHCYKIFERACRKAKNDFCSAKCKNASTGKIVKLKCTHCKLTFEKQSSKLKNSKSGLFFCSRLCKNEAQKYVKEIQPDHYGTGSNYRSIAFSKYKPICNRCGFSNFFALEVHHIDRNRNNNNVDNLEILCANCHSIEHKGCYRRL